MQEPYRQFPPDKPIKGKQPASSESGSDPAPSHPFPRYPPPHEEEQADLLERGFPWIGSAKPPVKAGTRGWWHGDKNGISPAALGQMLAQEVKREKIFTGAKCPSPVCLQSARGAETAEISRWSSKSGLTAVKSCSEMPIGRDGVPTPVRQETNAQSWTVWNSRFVRWVSQRRFLGAETVILSHLIKVYFVLFFLPSSKKTGVNQTQKLRVYELNMNIRHTLIEGGSGLSGHFLNDDGRGWTLWKV